MAGKLNVPSAISLNTEGLSFSTVVFLQAVQDALSVVDNSVVYRDVVQTVVAPPRIQRATATGQSFSVAGVNLASGDDYAALVSDFNSLLQSHISLQQSVDTLTKELRGE